jgi:hypothetical protein
MADPEEPSRPTSAIGPFPVIDIGPAEGAVVPMVDTGCGDCHWGGGLGGLFRGVLGRGVRTCKMRVCWIESGRIKCVHIPYSEECTVHTLFMDRSE